MHNLEFYYAVNISDHLHRFLQWSWKSDKFCSEALFSAWGSFTCHKSTTRDPRLYCTCTGKYHFRILVSYIVNEHKRNPTNGEIDKSKMAEHSWEKKHRFHWDKASILSTEENSRIKKLKESTFIHCTDHVISQPSTDISPNMTSNNYIRKKRKKKLWHEI